jgi:hypothetical protein
MIAALHGLAFTQDNVILTEFFAFFLALAMHLSRLESLRLSYVERVATT